MIENFVRTLLQPLYSAIGSSIPILIVLFSGILLFFFIGQLKMHVGKKRDSEIKDSFVPYMTDEELNYVFTGKKK